jgi:hypothetical protein
VKPEAWPRHVLVKVMALDAAARALAERLPELEARIARGRALLDGRVTLPQDWVEAELARAGRELPALLGERDEVARRLAAEEAMAARCRRWLEALPADAALEPVEVTVPPVARRHAHQGAGTAQGGRD